jgi:hypothetical protein
MAVTQVSLDLVNKIREYVGLSTDAKPTSSSDEIIRSGSLFYESDTSKVFMYDAGNVNPTTSNKWWEVL